VSLDRRIPGYKPRKTKEVSRDNSTTEIYDNEYIKQYIERDPFVFDPDLREFGIEKSSHMPMKIMIGIRVAETSTT